MRFCAGTLRAGLAWIVVGAKFSDPGFGQAERRSRGWDGFWEVGGQEGGLEMLNALTE